MLIFKSAQVIKYYVMFAFLFVQTVCCNVYVLYLMLEELVVQPFCTKNALKYMYVETKSDKYELPSETLVDK